MSCTFLPTIQTALVLLAAVALQGCSLADLDQDIFTLYVAPHTVECEGVGPMECLLVREDPGAPWRTFYGAIQGFIYEPGWEYSLRVARRKVADPPADRSSFTYHLIRILEQRPSTST